MESDLLLEDLTFEYSAQNKSFDAWTFYLKYDNYIEYLEISKRDFPPTGKIESCISKIFSNYAVEEDRSITSKNISIDRSYTKVNAPLSLSSINTYQKLELDSKGEPKSLRIQMVNRTKDQGKSIQLYREIISNTSLQISELAKIQIKNIEYLLKNPDPSINEYLNN